ncbi:DUF6422 family protein [Streptomyces sp. NPDC057494]|uniref:DUF6422 family protein n=1 Tax=Streptomyces sp. NPDC057494 TaxID=3346148 RepID=UPI00368C2636
MSESPRYGRTDDQARMLTEAALLLVDARRKALELVRASGAELGQEERDFVGDLCTADREAPPPPHRCACPRYRGSGGDDKCRTVFPDPYTGGWGGEHPMVRCGHLKVAHGI